jgi:hypothetical protein
MAIIPVLRLKQEDPKFKANLDHPVKPYFKDTEIKQMFSLTD